MPRTSPLLVPLLVVAALAAGCGDDGDAADEPDGTTTTTEPEVTTTAVDPFSVPEDPADITEEYVEAVLTELEKINGDALRLAMEAGVTPAVSEVVEPVFNEELLAFRMNVLLTAAGNDWAGVRDNPGDVRSSVVELVHVQDDCIAVRVSEDYTEVAVSGESDVRLYVELAFVEGSANATGWRYDVRETNGVEAVPCAR